MKSAPPLSNKLALLVTVATAAGFFILLMFLPSPHHAKKSEPVLHRGQDQPAESAQVLFATRCVQCHALPSLTHRAPEDWRILVLKMNRYMKQTGHRALSDDQLTLVTGYIVEHQK